MYTLKLKKSYSRSFKKLDKTLQFKTELFLRDIRISPRDKGSCLHGGLKSYWKYRIGNHRIIVSIDDKEQEIHAIDIGDRREIYKRYE